MRQGFARAVVRDEMDRGVFGAGDTFVAVCAGQGDQALFAALGVDDVTLTNVDIEAGNALAHGGGDAVVDLGDARWEQADAHALPYADDSFDVAFVSDGLHHCRSPHRAVTEMYRVARKAVVVVESRDSAALRAARLAGLTDAFEFNRRLLATREQGGVDFGAVPNFVYRWTEREFEKLLTTYDPAHEIEFSYHHALSLPPRLTGRPGVGAVAGGLVRLAPRQANTFAMVARRAGLKPWLRTDAAGTPRLRDEVTGPGVQRRDRRPRARHHVVRGT